MKVQILSENRYAPLLPSYLSSVAYVASIDDALIFIDRWRENSANNPNLVGDVIITSSDIENNTIDYSPGYNKFIQDKKSGNFKEWHIMYSITGIKIAEAFLYEEGKIVIDHFAKYFSVGDYITCPIYSSCIYKIVASMEEKMLESCISDPDGYGIEDIAIDQFNGFPPMYFFRKAYPDEIEATKKTAEWKEF